MRLKDKKPEDLYFFASSLFYESAHLKNTKGIIKMAGVALPFVLLFYLRNDNIWEIMPRSKLIDLYLASQFVFLFVFIIDLLRKKAKYYEARICRDGAISSLFFGYGMIFIYYYHFFDDGSGGILFSDFNPFHVELYKKLILYFAFLIPIIGIIYGIYFYFKKLKNRETHIDYVKKVKKTEKNYQSTFSLFLKILPFILLFFFLLYTIRNIIDAFFIILLIILCFFMGFLFISMILAAYVKKRFPEYYLQQNFHRLKPTKEKVMPYNFKVFRRPLVFNHLHRFKDIRKEEDFELGLAFSEYFGYQGYYRVGPDMCSLKPEKNQPGLWTCQYFVSFNVPVKVESSEQYCYLENFQLKDTFMARIADNEADYFRVNKEFRIFLEKNFTEKISEETYFVTTEVYDPEIYESEVLDVYIPIIKEGEEK